MPTSTNAPTTQLAELRQHAGYSQAEVADWINEHAPAEGHRGAGVTANTVSRWERGLIVPSPIYRRLLARRYGVEVAELGIPLGPPPRNEGPYVIDADMVLSPRVDASRKEWCWTRQGLNAHRVALSQTAARVYPAAVRLENTGLIAPSSWLPAEPVQLEAIRLDYAPDAPAPELDGTEEESATVRPLSTVTRPFSRYTQAVRNLVAPRLFENRPAWRLLDVDWSDPVMAFGPTSYFAAVDVNEVVAHELACVHLDDDGNPQHGAPAMRDLRYRRMLGDPFNCARRPIMPAISTLTIRAGDEPTFLLHRRDSRSVAMAGDTLQVIPSGIFQPSSVLPAATAEDFSLTRNIEREFAEELLGFPEHDGDGQPISYLSEPFATMDAALASGAMRMWCLGVALDALTLVGEILTVAVVAPDVFDELAADFVEVNDEGTVVAERQPFTEAAIAGLLRSGRMAPAGAGCLTLAWRHRDALLG